MSDVYRQSVRQMDRKTYDRLVEALAIGRWPDGRGLSDDQRQSAMQAVITWGELHLAPEDRVAFINKANPILGRQVQLSPGDHCLHR